MQGTMKRSSTVQAVLQEVRRDIIMGSLENDTPITELQFSAHYGCSRAALRGALTVLEQEGLIRVMPNGTKRICSLTTEDINHLYELRTYVECTAAKQILQKESMDISRLLKVLEEAKETLDFLDSDALFHETLVAMSGNKALMQTWKTFVPVTRELFVLNFSLAEGMKESLEERHMLIAKLLLERDEQAVQVLQSHIEEARRLSVGKN
ncbi:MAG: GntR family transcriptional regulator [Ruminococcaceae bacterium]|nr:GntR family transcriptional regulator [Oscillospiraceae bacterium]